MRRGTSTAALMLAPEGGSSSGRKYLLSESQLLSETNLSAETYSKIFTDVIDGQDLGTDINGVPQGNLDTDDLHNGAVSVYQSQDNKFNGASLGGGGIAAGGKLKNGDIKVVARLHSDGKKLLSTVSNVINVLVPHEFTAHGKLGYGDENKNHRFAYELQKKHPSYQNITPQLKQDINENHEDYIEDETGN